MLLDLRQVQSYVDNALQEDLTWGDVTSDYVIPEGVWSQFVIHFKENGVLAGIPVAKCVFETLDPHCEIECHHHDGQFLLEGSKVLTVTGDARALLKAERTALNFLQRLSGIATTTHHYVQKAKEGSSHTKVVDTRKTTPGLRYLEKYAVRLGGGYNHRFNLSDAVMLKDNHLAILKGCGGSLAEALHALKSEIPHTVKVEVEVDYIDQIPEVLEGGADVILLDNMSVEELSQSVELIAGRALTEASGGVSLDRISEIARTGVDLISVGSLTHSVKALDMGLDFKQNINHRHSI